MTLDYTADDLLAKKVKLKPRNPWVFLPVISRIKCLFSLSLPLFLRPLLGCHCQYNLSSFAGGGGGGVVVVWPRSIIVATCGEVQAFFASRSDRILLKQQQAVELLSLVQLPV